MKFKVFATREGLVGKKTATGHLIIPNDLFVALPAVRALRRWVNVYYKESMAIVPVLDVGPWNVRDNYWDRQCPIPWAEIGKRDSWLGGPPKNKAGIDLADGVFYGLGLKDNDWVEWEFTRKPDNGIAIIV